VVFGALSHLSKQSWNAFSQAASACRFLFAGFAAKSPTAPNIPIQNATNDCKKIVFIFAIPIFLQR
jgi:hypothetical protein